MRILFDILHPAHVHFFRNAIEILKEKGHQVTVTARDKDLTIRLLNTYRIQCVCISHEAGSKLGLARELLLRNLRLARIVRRLEPDVMVSIGGVSTSQVGFLTRTRNLIFYDTENATVSNLLSYPFATEVITPSCYRSRVIGRHTTYSGYHELAYLHKRRFVPDTEVLEKHGVDPSNPYSVVRFVSWKAIHDVKATGFSLDHKRELVRILERFGEVYITSESSLPGYFDRFRLPIPPHLIHHLLAFSQMFIGESATMASESVVLGTPAVYLDVVGRGYTDEQERRYELCFNFRPWEAEQAIKKAANIMRDRLKDSPEFKLRVERMLSEKVDVTEYIVKRILEES